MLFSPFNIVAVATTDSSQELKHNYSRGNYSSIRQCLQQIDWSNLLQGMAVEECWECFSGKLKSLINEFIPKVHNKCKFKNPYITSDVTSIRKKKFALWRQYVESQNPIDYFHFTKIRNKL